MRAKTRNSLKDKAQDMSPVSGLTNAPTTLIIEYFDRRIIGNTRNTRRMSMERTNVVRIALIFALALWSNGPAHAAQITILVNQGALSGVRDLAAGFEKASGHKVVIDFVGVPEQAEKINTDAPGDVVVNFMPAFEDLIKRNKSIGHSNGGTGPYNTRLFQKLGIYDQIKDKIKIIQGKPVAVAVADGEVEIGIQQTNVIQPVAGTQYLGPLPPDLIEYGHFGVAVRNVSKNQDVARELIKFMTSPEGAALLRKTAMEPPER